MDEPNLLLFARQETTGPKTIMCVDLDPADCMNLGWVATASLDYEAFPNGMPIDREYKRVSHWEDRLLDALAPLGWVYFGHINGMKRMVVVFRTEGPGPKEVTIKTGLLSKVTIPLYYRADENWNWHDSELAPTRRERMMINDRQLHDQLEDLGNIADIPRPVDFTARFPSAEAGARFVQMMVEKGFTPVNNPVRQESAEDFWCDLRRETSVDPETIASISIEVEDLAQAGGGFFDGWGCPVKNSR